jgi:uncharacterized Ntn-hydrolase superfamily protein
VTYSIAAANTRSREIGGAGTSCLRGDDVYVIYAASPGRGVVHAQARYSARGRDEALNRLTQGELPAAIVSAITSPSFDGNAEIRQYAIVDVLGNSAGFTGAETMAYAGDRQGAVGELAYSVQGNILTSARVLDQAALAFEQRGCDLPERLMNALEAGASGGEGDNRCTPSGIPADSAFLQVESPERALGDYLALRVETSGTRDPLPLLRQKLDASRAEHPCPAPVTPSLPAPSAPSDDGSGCRSAHASADASWLLLGGCLVVASLRGRAARELRPRHFSRQQASPPVPSRKDAELCANEVHCAEEGGHHDHRRPASSSAP